MGHRALSAQGLRSSREPWTNTYGGRKLQFCGRHLQMSSAPLVLKVSRTFTLNCKFQTVKVLDTFYLETCNAPAPFFKSATTFVVSYLHDGPYGVTLLFLQRFHLTMYRIIELRTNGLTNKGQNQGDHQGQGSDIALSQIVQCIIKCCVTLFTIPLAHNGIKHDYLSQKRRKIIYLHKMHQRCHNVKLFFNIRIIIYNAAACDCSR